MTRRLRLKVERVAPVGGIQPLAVTARRHLRAWRVRAGEEVELFDGGGHSALGRVERAGREPALRVVGPVAEDAPESPVRLVLVQALPSKLPRFEPVVRMATELGAASVVPLLSVRSRLPAGGAATLARRRQRWQRIAEAAAEQCGRRLVPPVAPVLGWAELEWEGLPRPYLLLDPEGDTTPSELVNERPRAATLFVGPEGGFAAEERAELVRRGALAVALGPRVLRADTAGAVALAVLQFLWGDLASRT